MTGSSFNALGVAVVAVVFWISSQQAQGEARSAFNSFLFVLLLSMILLNWSRIKPIFFKGGSTNVQSP